MENREPNYAKLVEYVRNNLVEQVHFGLILHINKDGIIQKIGDDNYYKFYHRSCMKPMQSSVLIDLKTEEKYKLTQQELALCCASHTGDKVHQKAVKSILDKIECCEDDLLCPAHEPLSKRENEFLIKNSLPYTKIHNNCSGKHSAMLALCKQNGFDIKNYTSLNHPLSTLIINHVYNLCGVKKSDVVISQDGCGLPVVATSLEELGRGFLNLFTNPKYEKITKAFLNNPVLIGGENRLDTQIIENTHNIVAKVGACGLCVIVNLEKKESVIIKIADSNMQARAITAFEILKQLKWAEETSALKNLIEREIRIFNNKVGVINTCFRLT